jgi:hypothetical protein
MAFYAAALATSAVGSAAADTPWSVGAGLEFSYIPRLNREQRTAGFDKPESSNLSPVLPRLRVALSTPGDVRVEVGWLPPVEVFDASAHLYSIALSRAFPNSRLVLAPRVAASGGRARGSITCNEALLHGTSSEQVYYRAVCHLRESDDHFEPRQLSAELIISRNTRRSIMPFASVGIRHDDVRFDIGVLRSDGTRDTDHPILVMRTTRPFVAGGAAWRRGRMGTAAELYYAPGSLITGRVRVDVRVHGTEASSGAR